MKPQTIGASIVAGLATGPRSFTGLAAVVFATPPQAQAQPDRALGHPAAKTAIGLLAMQEWIVDKLPKTPSRLEAVGLIARATGAGAAGAILARRAQVADPTPVAGGPGPALTEQAPGEPAEPPTPDWAAICACAATSAVVALGVAVIGVHLRAGFDKLFGQDWPAAALEDASSAGLAAAAVYLSAVG